MSAALSTYKKGDHVTSAWLPNGGIITQIFGIWEYLPQFGINAPHEGIDIAGTRGDPIVVPEHAKVEAAGWDAFGGGNYVKLAMDDGTSVMIFHMQNILVKAGQDLSPGHLLGHMDSTGSSTGDHVHFQVNEGEKAVDPWNWLMEKTKVVGGSSKDDPCAGLTGFAAAWCQVTHVAPAAPSGLDKLGVVLNAATEPRNWWKALFVGIGITMIGTGIIIYFFQEEKTTVIKIAHEAEEAAPVVAAA